MYQMGLNCDKTATFLIGQWPFEIKQYYGVHGSQAHKSAVRKSYVSMYNSPIESAIGCKSW